MASACSTRSAISSLGRLATFKSVTDVFLDGQKWKQGIVLKHGVDAAPVGREVVEPVAAHDYFSRVCALESCDDSQQRRFAGAAFAENGEEFAFRDLQGDIAKHCGWPNDLATLRMRKQRRAGRLRV